MPDEGSAARAPVPRGRRRSGSGPRVGARERAAATIWRAHAAGPCSLREAHAHCDAFARAHSEIYPLVSALVAPAVRPHLLAVYAFARSADDFADEPEHEAYRHQALDIWQEQLERCFHGEAEHPIFVALRAAIDQRHLALPPFEALLAGLRMDIEVRRYELFSGLRQFTAQCAESVSRILLALFGYDDPRLVNHAAEISTALQLTSFWRDVAVDVQRDHIYLPGEDLHFFGVREAELRARRSTPELRDLMRFEVARTRELYERGRPLLSRLGDDLRFEIALIWDAGVNILAEIESVDFDAFAGDTFSSD